jgi:hypothetical protein
MEREFRRSVQGYEGGKEEAHISFVIPDPSIKT